MSNHKNTRKIMIALGVVGAAAAVAGMGTFGTFTSTTSGTQAVGSGTVKIELGAGGTNTLSVPASKVVPGDTIQRAVTLNNTGTADLATITLTTAATTSSKLDTDGANGLKLQVDSCPSAWTQGGTAELPTFTCSGTLKNLVVAKPVIGANTPIAPTTALTAGASDNLRVTVTLPTAADNTFQGLNSTIGFTFDAPQRNGANR